MPKSVSKGVCTQTVISPHGRCIVVGGRTHKKYMDEGLMTREGTIKKVTAAARAASPKKTPKKVKSAKKVKSTKKAKSPKAKTPRVKKEKSPKMPSPRSSPKKAKKTAKK